MPPEEPDASTEAGSAVAQPAPAMAEPAPDGALPLDANLIKVLASDTRVELLRLLHQRRMTVTELAKATNLSKATLLEHLERLTQAGLVRRREDERIWVYYELTRRGGRIVNPGHARFYLVVGTAAGALVIGAALVLALQAMMAAPPMPSSSGASLEDAQATGAPSLALLKVGDPFAGTATQVQAVLQGADRGTVYLVPASSSVEDLRSDLKTDSSLDAGQPTPTGAASGSTEEAMRSRLDSLDADAEGVPLGTLQAGAPETLVVPASVPPGTYYVFVQTADGRDNRASMPVLRVEALHATFASAVWWRGLDGDLAITLAPAAKAQNGTLVLSAGARTLSAPVRDAKATVAAATLDAAPPGRYAARFIPEAGGAVPLLETFEVREPQVAVSPLDLLAGVASDVRVTVATPGRAAPAPQVVVAGASVQGRDTTGSFQVLRLQPTGAEDVLLQAGRLTAQRLTVHPYVAPSFTALPGPELELALAGADGAPLASVGVLLDGAPQGFTNESGKLRLPPPSSGEHRASFLLPGGASAERALQVQGWNVSELAPRVVLAAAAEPAAPARARFAVAVANPSAAAEAFTLLGLHNGQALASARLEVPAHGNATAVLEAASVQTGDLSFQVQAFAAPRAPLRFLDRTAPPAPTPPASPPPSPPASGGGAGAPMPPAAPTAPASEGPTPVAGSAQVEVHVAPLPSPSNATIFKAGLVPLRDLGRASDMRDELAAKPGGAAAAPSLEAALLAVALAGVALAARRRRGA